MFEFSRELRRFFTADGPRDGLTGGQAPLLELLDLTLLRGEAKAAEIAAGRVSAKDPAERDLAAARVWREVARRTGDVIALRKAAAAAERASKGFRDENRTRPFAMARCEAAAIALVGVDLFGDEGLAAAAQFTLDEVRAVAPASAASALAWGRQLRLRSRALMLKGDPAGILALAREFDGPITALESLLRGRAVTKLEVLHLRCDRAELLYAAGARLRDSDLLQQAVVELDLAAARADATYEPLAWVRVHELRGSALAALGDARGDIESMAKGVSVLADALDVIAPHHSPLDWARLQHSLAVALGALAGASDSEHAFEQALSCFDRTLVLLDDQPAISLKAAASANRAACLARRAELTGDLAEIDQAIEALKSELHLQSADLDPVAWAVCQVDLARLYEIRMQVRGSRAGEVAAAALALSSALDVFAEQGLRTMSDGAVRALDRLSVFKS